MTYESEHDARPQRTVCSCSSGLRLGAFCPVHNPEQRKNRETGVLTDVYTPAYSEGMTNTDTVTISRKALLDLLTTAGCLARDAKGGTREDVTNYLESYGFATPHRVDRLIAHAEKYVAETL